MAKYIISWKAQYFFFTSHFSLVEKASPDSISFPITEKTDTVSLGRKGFKTLSYKPYMQCWLHCGMGAVLCELKKGIWGGH